MVKDLGAAADSESMKAMNMSNPNRMNEVEDAATARWLAAALAPEKRRIRQRPADEVIERIRARVFSDAAPRKVTRSIAA